ncbi:kinase-like protein [Macrolepiota fuliginosa MF-IS2]|uniref:Kinase-like protein n=1 Tax=Macrolepiota fuliginosa MF-IS2 TaxID=1400762 RepID=A0A9P6C6V5_9AGAR|nr:kinase-like protein [Macrolepiota fuliginosa MF-IS2]
MEAPTLASPTTESNDVFSISDQALSDRLQFIQEIGFGNWGSVWLCRPKLSSSSADGLANATGQKIAVKLVHRSKTSTTAARVRSLWNEMKIVRAFKNDPHPSIIPFHSFVLTPSYALITMTYLPTLIPVEVEESKAKEWFRFLLSGVEFLHRRGVVHNDIKPANILLSHKNVPVLVDFGFAEKYDVDSPTAFHSNLSYGTPEYLSPERARGLPHDTRKSDVWSLGITLFEILIGRTPFESTDGEQLTTKEDLEKYWQRTLRGNWIGTWKMSTGLEKLLQRMIAPNADLRCTASQAMADEFWRPRKESISTHRRSSSYTSSVVFEKDMAKLLDLTPSSTRSGKENLKSPPGLESPLASRRDLPSRQLNKSKSQPKVATSKTTQPRKRPHVPPIPDLSPIKASPPASPLSSASGKENSVSTKGGASSTARRAFGVLASRNENLPQGVKPPVSGTTKEKAGKVLGDATNNGNVSRRNSQDVKEASLTASQRNRGKESTSVRDRVRDWERERERLREMARLEEIERERDEEIEREKREQERVKKQKKISIKEPEANKENHHGTTAFNNIVLPLPAITPPLTQVLNIMSIPETPTRPTSPHNKKIGHVIRASIDKTLQVYKSSTLAQVTTGRSTPARSLDIDIKDIKTEIDPPRTRGSSQNQSWENEVNSSLPVVRNAVQREKVAADSRMDRLTIWMQNVERVVEDARQNFAASAKVDAPLPSLPAAPAKPRDGSHNRSARSTRLPRKVLAASQIFADYNNSLMVDASSSANTSAITSDVLTSSASVETPSGSILSRPATADPSQSQFVIPEIHTPSRQRRATVSENSPVAIPRDAEMSPSKRREKSRSHGNFLQQRIASMTQLEAEINKPIPPEPSPRLSEMFDRSIFIATPIRSCENLESPFMSSDDLTGSPCHVEPYPQRKLGAPDALPDTPSQRRMEGVYDRFLMASSGVKRVGKGYQSDFIPPPPAAFNNQRGSGSGINRRQSRVFFGTSRIPMPPPVSSDDVAQRRGVSVDELGIVTYGPASDASKDESGGNSTVAFMRKAIKAMKPSTKNSKRLSKMVVA